MTCGVMVAQRVAFCGPLPLPARDGRGVMMAVM